MSRAVGLLSAILTATTRATVRFGIITDPHYADAPAHGTRYYRDSIPKLRDAVSAIAAERPDFLMELGDIKDATAACATSPATLNGTVTAECIAETIGFVDRAQA